MSGDLSRGPRGRHDPRGEARETLERTQERGDRDFFALQETPFFELWACAGIDDILSAHHERLVVGSLSRQRDVRAGEPGGEDRR